MILTSLAGQGVVPRWFERQEEILIKIKAALSCSLSHRARSCLINSKPKAGTGKGQAGMRGWGSELDGETEAGNKGSNEE